MLVWKPIHPSARPEMLGYLTAFISEADPRSAREQLDAHYGWRPFEGFTMAADGDLEYPGDPPTHPIYRLKLRDETVTLYEHAWVVVTQSDGSFEVCRMD
jgi:hypothetical protein